MCLCWCAVVHGAPRVADDPFMLDTINHVTVLPNPCLYSCCLQVRTACSATNGVELCALWPTHALIQFLIALKPKYAAVTFKRALSLVWCSVVPAA